MKPVVGILGLGDLGSRLAVQAIQAGFEVIAFDKDPHKRFTSHLAIDPAVSFPSENVGIRVIQSAQEVIDGASLIHWAIPSSLLQVLQIDLSDKVIVLHDSVMANSVAALAKRDDADRFAIVHCLINDARRVFVADGQNSEVVVDHFAAIGLSPKLTTPQEHDSLMAHSQGMMASLLAMGLRAQLDEASINGDLTPSSEELHKVLINRELNWTPSTLASILANPELQDISEELTQVIRSNGKN